MAYTDIDKPSDYFNTLLWTGTGVSRSITGVGFQPDFAWIKSRSNATLHLLYDSVRGAGAEKELASDYPNAEGFGDSATYGYLSSFDSDGYSTVIGSDTNNDGLNASSQTFVGWNWLAGGTASSNTDGSITSQVSANTTSGFSVATWSGSGADGTVGHGLGQTPDLVIVKNRSVSYNWFIYHRPAFGDNQNKAIYFTTAATTTGFTTQPFKAFTSSTVQFGNNGGVNGSGNDYVGYFFSNKKGFSKFGSYTGNGNADGTFVYTGFKPAFVLLKNTDAVEQWWIFDNKRNAYTGNFIYYALNPNGSSTENTTLGDNNHIDFLSNGFKLRTTAAQLNGSGNSLIYMAFAENPLVGTNNIPATAR